MAPVEGVTGLVADADEDLGGDFPTGGEAGMGLPRTWIT